MTVEAVESAWLTAVVRAEVVAVEGDETQSSDFGAGRGRRGSAAEGQSTVVGVVAARKW